MDVILELYKDIGVLAFSKVGLLRNIDEVTKHRFLNSIKPVADKLIELGDNVEAIDVNMVVSAYVGLCKKYEIFKIDFDTLISRLKRAYEERVKINRYYIASDLAEKAGLDVAEEYSKDFKYIGVSKNLSDSHIVFSPQVSSTMLDDYFRSQIKGRYNIEITSEMYDSIKFHFSSFLEYAKKNWLPDSISSVDIVDVFCELFVLIGMKMPNERIENMDLFWCFVRDNVEEITRANIKSEEKIAEIIFNKIENAK